MHVLTTGLSWFLTYIPHQENQMKICLCISRDLAHAKETVINLMESPVSHCCLHVLSEDVWLYTLDLGSNNCEIWLWPKSISACFPVKMLSVCLLCLSGDITATEALVPFFPWFEGCFLNSIQVCQYKRCFLVWQRPNDTYNIRKLVFSYPETTILKAVKVFSIYREQATGSLQD